MYGIRRVTVLYFMSILICIPEFLDNQHNNRLSYSEQWGKKKIFSVCVPVKIPEHAWNKMHLLEKQKLY